MQNINEVFAELDARIDKIKELKSIINAFDFVKREYNINSIERNIFRFKDEAPDRIAISIKELENLIVQGISILSLNSFLKDDYFQDQEYTKEDEIEAQQRREVAYNFIKSEIQFYLKKLKELENKFKSNNEIGKETKRPEIVLGNDFSLPKLKTTNPQIEDLKLNKEQISILFYYLRENNFILPYDAKSLSKLISLQTGYSENTLRQEVFGNIHDVKNKVPYSSKKGKEKLTNLHIVKAQLEQLLFTIESDLKKTFPKE